MGNKSMLWFWLVGAGAIVVDFIGFIVVFVAVLTAVQSGVTNPYAILYGSMFIWTVVIGILSTVQLIMGIIHLVFYSKKRIRERFESWTCFIPALFRTRYYWFNNRSSHKSVKFI